MLCGSALQTHWEGASSCWDLRKLVAWPLKFNIEEPSIALNSCLHFVFVSERTLTSIIAYSVLTNNVLLCTIHLFGDTGNIITISGYCGEFFFLYLRFCQPGGMLCHALRHQCRQFFPPRPLLPCLPSLGHCRI